MAAASSELSPMDKALTWEIDNFSERKGVMTSDPFSSGGCKWCVMFFPKGHDGNHDLSMFLHDANWKSLSPGWKRRAHFRLYLLNQSGKHLYRSPGQNICSLFCAEDPGWGFRTNLTLAKLQEQGFLEKNKLIIQVYIKVVEVVHQGKSTANEMLDFNGFQIIASQSASVNKIFKEHPGFANAVIPKNRGAYTNLLLGLVNTLSKSPQMLSMTELSNAQSELTELSAAGFKLDWLKSKLEEVSLERERALSDGSRVQQLEERVNNVELALSDLKVELEKQKIKFAAAAAIFSSFEFIDSLIKRFFISCFSISKH
ncbi:hypothetical protein EUTSA_v10008254mg [Eutrema salsugineum]|uniref:MATH domain-containing protein n=3 Tax=Eutrema salsugineum TaxID=72664 RepID=V4L383_EUTSA|nr:hypothetical protein EUTSA_v10008254mg [Eutrema salsugineum]ESQ36742.1 hypothetical protein EUTSA_v10008254mg [Eutrema salsugineum]